jgi:hypothetical protein
VPRNIYISHGTQSEQNLLADILAETIKIYGHDVFYIPRKIVKLDRILNEDVLSNFPDAYMVEMYVENVDGFEGDGKLITKFALEIRDQMTLVVSRRRWDQLVGRFGYPAEQVRPAEGDLIYIPMVKGLFEVKFVKDFQPFYQLNNLPTYKLIVEQFEYNHQKIDTGVDEIDSIQSNSSQGFSVLVSHDLDTIDRFERHDKIAITFGSGISGSCEILSVKETDDDFINEVHLGPITYDDGLFRPLAIDNVLFCEERDVTGKIFDVFTIGNALDKKTNINDRIAQNSSFEIEGNAWVDFSEINPFGEIKLPS